jgi:hypothetical protein
MATNLIQEVLATVEGIERCSPTIEQELQIAQIKALIAIARAIGVPSSSDDPAPAGPAARRPASAVRRRGRSHPTVTRYPLRRPARWPSRRRGLP